MPNTVVIGANKGIGLELTKQLSLRGDSVIAACRESSDALSALRNITIYEGVDVSSDQSVKDFGDKFSDITIDLLIHNAGILTIETFEELNIERIRRQFEVNTLGPLRVVSALSSKFKQGSKIGIVSSRVGSLADNESGGYYGYRISKTAVNMAGVNLAHDLKPKGVALALLHPGFVQTSMTGGSGNIGPSEAARGLIERMDVLSLETTGTFWHAEGYELPW